MKDKLQNLFSQKKSELFDFFSRKKTEYELIRAGEVREESDIPKGNVDTDERSVVRFGVLTLVIGFGGFLLWAGLAPLDEGVPGTGIVSVDTKRKTVQHLRGGVVEKIEVREGDHVKAGDVLIRLNDTEVTAQLDIVRGQYYLTKAMESRLLAEREGRDAFAFPEDLVEAAKTLPRAAEALRAQSQLFSARRSALKSEMSTIDENISGLNNQTKGLQSLETGKKTQIDLINKELSSLRGLVEEGFVPRNKLYELERVLADLSGSRGESLAQMGRTQAAINEMKLRKLQRQQDYLKEVETHLAEAQKEGAANADRLHALQEEFERTIIKAPTTGHVVGLEVHTIGGIIRPGDRITDVIPEGDALIVEAQLPVNLIDKVHVGQLANMHLQLVLAGGAQPSIEGKVVQVSADRLTEPRSGMPYYSARIQITPNGEAEILKNKIKVQPGMQADIVVITGERTLLQYLLRPLMSRITSGMKEL